MRPGSSCHITVFFMIMFGIKDFFIILPYLLGVGCLIFSAIYGLKTWKANKKDGKEDME